MASIYDKIKTARELLIEVQIHGFSTKDEDICRAQDIIGRTSVEELDALANDNGIDGGMRTGRRVTQAVFYQVLFHIWYWEEATRFYNQHSNSEYKKLRESGVDAQKTKEQLAKAMEDIQREHEVVLNERSKVIKLERELEGLSSELHDREMTIMELKAKLYDLTVKEEK